MQSLTESAKSEALLQESLREKSFIQKWEQVCALREIAWNLKAARLRSQHPEWTESQVQEAVKKIFLYGTT